MIVEHVAPIEWVDTVETGVIQPSHVAALPHLVTLEEQDLDALRGPAGPQGEAGATGQAGPAGPQGETGPAGATGALNYCNCARNKPRFGCQRLSTQAIWNRLPARRVKRWMLRSSVAKSLSVLLRTAIR